MMRIAGVAGLAAGMMFLAGIQPAAGAELSKRLTGPQISSPSETRAEAVLRHDPYFRKLVAHQPWFIHETANWYSVSGQRLGAGLSISLPQSPSLRGLWPLLLNGKRAIKFMAVAHVSELHARIAFATQRVVALDPAGLKVRITAAPGLRAARTSPARPAPILSKGPPPVTCSCGDAGGYFGIYYVPGTSDWFYNWDFHNTTSGTGFGNADFPVTFVFFNNANINKVKNALWMFGVDGVYTSPKNARLNDGAGAVWDTDKGRKDANCTDTHYRVYADSDDAMYDLYFGYFVFATTHYDYYECPGGPSSQFGWSEDAEHSLASQASFVWGQNVFEDNISLGNGPFPAYWVADHYYQNNGQASSVAVP